MTDLLGHKEPSEKAPVLQPQDRPNQSESGRDFSLAPVSSKDEAVDEGERAQGQEENRQLLPPDRCQRFDSEWQAIQASFVDSPRTSVEKADALVTKTIDAIASSFAGMRGSLERTWEKDMDVSTEDLRVALQNYRSFFRRLLSV